MSALFQDSSAMLAQQHIDDLRREAEARRLAGSVRRARRTRRARRPVLRPLPAR
jgi:hypothetical protein